MSTREAVIESLAGYSVTSFRGRRPKATDIDTLERELAGIAAQIKTSIYEGGDVHGHLCCVITQDAYRTIIGDPDWEYAEAETPEAYDPEITAAMGDVERKSREAEWDKFKTDYQKYLGVQHALRQLLIGAVDSQYIAQLYNEYTFYTQNSVKQMLNHLRTKVKLNESQRTAMRKQIYFEWDQTRDFTWYITELESVRRRLARWNINIDEPTMIAAAHDQIKNCTTFTKEAKKMWDDLDDDDKSWQVFKEHFIEKYDEEEAYAEETAGRGGLQGVNEIQETDNALAEYLCEIKLAANSQTETIQEINTKTLSVITELTSKISKQTKVIAAQQKTITAQQATITKLTADWKPAGGGGKGGGTGGGSGEAEKQQELHNSQACVNCKKMVLHKDKNCLELPENAHKRKKGWKSVFEGMKNPHYDE